MLLTRKLLLLNRTFGRTVENYLCKFYGHYHDFVDHQYGVSVSQLTNCTTNLFAPISSSFLSEVEMLFPGYTLSAYMLIS